MGSGRPDNGGSEDQDLGWKEEQLRPKGGEGLRSRGCGSSWLHRAKGQAEGRQPWGPCWGAESFRFSFLLASTSPSPLKTRWIPSSPWRPDLPALPQALGYLLGLQLCPQVQPRVTWCGHLGPLAWGGQ